MPQSSLHPRLTPVGAAIGGPSSRWLADVGTYGAWSDLQFTTRFGEGACGMYEAKWSMPLPAGFDDPILRRGTVVELMAGVLRVGSPLILTEPARGSGFDDPWQFVATGIGREVEGDHGYYAIDGSGNSTATPSVAVDAAIARGLQWAGRNATVPTFAMDVPADELITLGALLNLTGQWGGSRWGVGQDSIVGYLSDPTTPAYHVIPDVVELGVADDNYATTVLVRYLDNLTHAAATVTATSATATATAARFGHREFAVDLTDRGEIAAANAVLYANGILARSKGRMGWANGMTLTSNELLTVGGEPADLVRVAEDVGTGCMVRIHGISNDLIDYNGQTWLDVIIGEATPAADGQSITLNPLGLAARDLAHIIEEVAGPVPA